LSFPIFFFFKLAVMALESESQFARIELMGKRIAIGGVLLALLFGCTLAFWPKKIVILGFGTQEYQVVSARFTRKKSVMLASDWRSLQLGRRWLDKVGIHLRGPRSDFPSDTESEVGTVLLLCDGPQPNPMNYSGLTNYILECSNHEGRKETVSERWAWQTGPSGHIWFLLPIKARYVYRDLTDFQPTEFQVRRRSDGQELMRVPIQKED
jgi:hypothetical protein